MLEWLLWAFLSPEVPRLGALQPPSSPSIAIIEPAALPVPISDAVEPRLLSKPFLAVLAQDPVSGKVLYEHQADRAQGIASLTKLMTYYVIRKSHGLDAVVTVDPMATKAVGAGVDLFAYEQLTVGTLLEAILIPSANDAAVALAIWDAGSEEAFVKKMNATAKQLGLSSAVFYNASGLDIEPEEGDSYGNVMSARDMMKLTRLLLRDTWFANAVQKRHFYGTSVDAAFLHEKVSTNRLFGSFVDTRGVKTGYTLWAGQCLVNLAVNEDGHQVVTVVLGSVDRFTETKHLVDWVWGRFGWK